MTKRQDKQQSRQTQQRARRGSRRSTDSRRTLFGLAFVFLLLTAVAWYVLREPTTVDPAEFGVPNAYPLFGNFQAEDVIYVRLQNPENGGSLTFTRQASGGWTVEGVQGDLLLENTPEATEATSLPENAPTTDSLTPLPITPTPGALEAALVARTLEQLPYLTTLDVQNADLRDYGYFPQGLFAIEFRLRDGTTHLIDIGDITPSREAYYAIVDERPDLYLIPHVPMDYLISVTRRR